MKMKVIIKKYCRAAPGTANDDKNERASGWLAWCLAHSQNGACSYSSCRFIKLTSLHTNGLEKSISYLSPTHTHRSANSLTNSRTDGRARTDTDANKQQEMRTLTGC